MPHIADADACFVILMPSGGGRHQYRAAFTPRHACRFRQSVDAMLSFDAAMILLDDAMLMLPYAYAAILMLRHALLRYAARHAADVIF